MTDEQDTEDTTMWCGRCGHALDPYTDRCFNCAAARRSAERGVDIEPTKES